MQISSRWEGWFPHSLLLQIKYLLKEHPDILQRSEPEIADYLLKALDHNLAKGQIRTREITGVELKVEDSLGNFTVEKRFDKAVIRIYDHVGRALILEHAIAAHGESPAK